MLHIRIRSRYLATVAEGGGGAGFNNADGTERGQHPDTSKLSGGRGACRAKAPSIAPPKTKQRDEGPPSEKENAKRILRTLATHLWPSKELQVYLEGCWW